jgi:hypothetical protein
VWEALEHDIEKDNKVRNNQSGKREVIHKDQSRTRRGKVLIKKDQGEFDGP